MLYFASSLLELRGVYHNVICPEELRARCNPTVLGRQGNRDFKSQDEIAAWYQTHSTVLIQDQLATLPARVGGKLRARLAARRGNGNPLPTGQRRTRSAQST
jgi:hypothetical protein